MQTMSDTQMTPLLLITGFLGSGKTTFINRFLRQFSTLPQAPKLGVVVNEFGQIGIDGALLGPGDIVEMGGGCICCATGEELWESALSLVERKGATHLLVETSGIADPEVLLQQYQDLSPSLKEKIDLKGVLCLVDAVHFPEAFLLRTEAKSQIRSADRLLFTKVDLLSSASQLEALHQLLNEQEVTSERTILSPQTNAADLLALFRFVFSTNNQKLLSSKQKKDIKKHERGQLQAFSFANNRPFLKAPFQSFLKELTGNILRAKGFVYFTENASVPYIVHLVGNQVELTICTEEQQEAAPLESTLVFIGENVDESWITLRLAACSL